jgi:hypothetical protein
VTNRPRSGLVVSVLPFLAQVTLSSPGIQSGIDP